MQNEPDKLIEAWFDEASSNDGEFLRYERTVPYSVIGNSGPTSRCVFTTKPQLLINAIERSRAKPDVGIIGRYGLPRESDLVWIRRLLAGARLSFLGDMDPVDLMVFEWLRHCLAPGEISYLGISDQFLGSLRIDVSTCAEIPLTGIEHKSLVVLKEICPNVMQTVGFCCSEILQRGLKIELEAIVNRNEMMDYIVDIL